MNLNGTFPMRHGRFFSFIFRTLMLSTLMSGNLLHAQDQRHELGLVLAMPDLIHLRYSYHINERHRLNAGLSPFSMIINSFSYLAPKGYSLNAGYSWNFHKNAQKFRAWYFNIGGFYSRNSAASDKNVKELRDNEDLFVYTGITNVREDFCFYFGPSYEIRLGQYNLSLMLNQYVITSPRWRERNYMSLGRLPFPAFGLSRQF